MVSLALLSSASLVCLTQFHTNCPHSTSHGESYRKGSKNQKLNQENGHKNMRCIKCDMCMSQEICTYLEPFLQSAITRNSKSIHALHFFFFKTSHIVAQLTVPILGFKVLKPIKINTSSVDKHSNVCVQC